MSNQILLWAMIILPWSLILIFMNKYYLKRFIAAGLLSIVLSILVLETGVTLNWWKVYETAYPLRTLSFLFGLNPVATMLILRFFYGRFLVYITFDLVINLGFSYIFLAYLSMRNIYYYAGLGPLSATLISTMLGILIYWYQIWQEGIFARK